jgi:hypothetical protein
MSIPKLMENNLGKNVRWSTDLVQEQTFSSRLAATNSFIPPPQVGASPSSGSLYAATSFPKGLFI